MFIIHTGLKHTRRKDLIAITDGDGRPRWTGYRIMDALMYLADNEIFTAQIRHEDRVLRIMLGTVSE